MFDMFMTAFSSACSLEALVANFIGVALGIVFGALPGLTAVMGVALLIPLTFGFSPVIAFSSLLGMYCGAIYAGSITAILVGTPGTAAAAATMLEGPQFTARGESLKALEMTTIASFIGGIFSCLVLATVAPQLAHFALDFSAPEYFSLGIFGLTIVATLSEGALLKGCIAALLGMLISMIGMDPLSGNLRMTFDSPDLIVPATGSGTASFAAYSETKRHSKHPELFGKGSIEGIAATESANNAVTGGALIPLLTLGVPGDVVTAIMLGALMIQGMTPGPLLFQEQGTLVYSIFIALFVSNVFMLLLGYYAVRLFAKVVLIPGGILMPLVTTLCVVGGYALNNSNFDLAVMAGFGLLGYIMTKARFPLAPLLLAMILSGIIETNFRRALSISNQDFSVFFTRPVCASFLAISLFILFNLLWKEWKKYRAASAA